MQQDPNASVEQQQIDPSQIMSKEEIEQFVKDFNEN